MTTWILIIVVTVSWTHPAVTKVEGYQNKVQCEWAADETKKSMPKQISDGPVIVFCIPGPSN